MTHISSSIIGWGHYLPSNILTNDDLSQMVDTNDEWITERTGMKTRHIAKEGEYTSDLCIKSAEMALDRAKLSATDIDLIIVATVTPDNVIPAVSTKTAASLGMRKGVAAFDVSAACSGFIYALTLADNMIRLGQVKNALVIGAETLSRIVDWQDRNTCVLFGDGAGAVVLTAVDSDAESRVIATKIFADGCHYDKLGTTGGISTSQNIGSIYMDGREVFKHAIPCLSEGVSSVLASGGALVSDVDWIIPHQANIRIIEGVSKKLSFPMEKIIVTLDHHGNTSAASIPLAFSESMESGKIKKGDLVVFTAMGAGFTWGGALVRV